MLCLVVYQVLVFTVCGIGIKLYCNDICKKFKFNKKYHKSYWQDNVKRCSFCDIFMVIDDYFCPCCRNRLKVRGKNLVSKRVKRIEGE